MEVKSLNEEINKAYKIWLDLKNNQNIDFNGQKIIFDEKPNDKTNRDEGFEHIISKNDGNKRIYDINRIKNISLIQKTLKICSENDYSNLKITNQGDRIVIKYKTTNYFIILSQTKDGYLLLTAYPEDKKIKQRVL